MFAPKCDFCESSCEELEESIGFVKLKDFMFIHACCSECSFKLQKKIEVFSLMTSDMIVYYDTKKIDHKTTEMVYTTEGRKIVKIVLREEWKS
jgi:hypothetical protein